MEFFWGDIPVKKWGSLNKEKLSDKAVVNEASTHSSGSWS
jgi:hypothetical protein